MVLLHKSPNGLEVHWPPFTPEEDAELERRVDRLPFVHVADFNRNFIRDLHPGAIDLTVCSQFGHILNSLSMARLKLAPREHEIGWERLGL